MHIRVTSVVQIGDVITILSTEQDEGWWLGLKGSGAQGLFPKNYVEML